MVRRQKPSSDLIPERRPSVTNSAWASMRLEQMGLGIRPIGEVLLDALKAEVVCYAKDGTLLEVRPDMRTRMEAIKMLERIHGLTHVPEQKTDVNVAFVQIVQDVKQKSLQELEQEAQRFLPRNRVGDVG